jgi:hypothetical protein
MWTAPRVNGQWQHALRYAVTPGYAMQHSALQIGRHAGIGGCSFYLIDISFDRYLFADGWRPFRPGAPKGIPQLRYAATAGHGARRSEAHQAPARRFMARAHRCLHNFRHLTKFGTVRSSQCLPGAPLRSVAFLATRDGHGSRRASNRVRCKAQLRQIVYTDINICIARLWLMLARPCQRRWEDPVSCALMSDL